MYEISHEMKLLYKDKCKSFHFIVRSHSVLKKTKDGTYHEDGIHNNENNKLDTLLHLDWLTIHALLDDLDLKKQEFAILQVAYSWCPVKKFFCTLLRITKICINTSAMKHPNITYCVKMLSIFGSTYVFKQLFSITYLNNSNFH